MIEGLQHLRLTKDKEEDIPISTMNKFDLMEECALSLFRKLLSDKQQNQRALKSTLRAAWKMGFELRIVDVGKDLGLGLGLVLWLNLGIGIDLGLGLGLGLGLMLGLGLQFSLGLGLSVGLVLVFALV